MSARVALLAAATVAACGGRTEPRAPDDARPAPPGDATAAAATPDAPPADGWLPAVVDPATLAPATTPVPAVVVLVEADDRVLVAPAPRAWGELDRDRLLAAARPAWPQDILARTIVEVAAEAPGDAGAAARAWLDRIPPIPSPDDDPFGSIGPIGVGRFGLGGGSGGGEVDVVVTVGAPVGAATPPVTPLVLAAPGATARRVVAVLERTGGVLGVAHDGGVRAFRVGFPWLDPDGGGAPEPAGDGPTFDLTIGAPGVALTRDGGGIGSAPRDADGRVRPVGLDDRLRYPDTVVDVLASPSATAAHLVEGLSLADANGAAVLGAAAVTWEPEITARLRSGAPEVTGSLASPIVRRYLRREAPRFRQCWAGPTAAAYGQVVLSFAIQPDGKVADATATGISPAVDGCVRDVIAKVEFPKPPDGDRVTVTYELIFAP